MWGPQLLAEAVFCCAGINSLPHGWKKQRIVRQGVDDAYPVKVKRAVRRSKL
jgi:hypothetical protein